MVDILDALSFLALVYIIARLCLRQRRQERRIDELTSLIEVLLEKIGSRHDM